MIWLLFHFEDNSRSIQSGRDVDMAVWQNLARAFGVDGYICIDLTSAGIRHSDGDLAYEQYTSLEQARKAHANDTWLYFCPESAIPGTPGYRGSNLDKALPYEKLGKMQHPKDGAVYVFGPDVEGFSLSDLPLSDKQRIVAIPMKSNTSMWAICAASAALWDRIIWLSR